jgi:hypothetical protein
VVECNPEFIGPQSFKDVGALVKAALPAAISRHGLVRPARCGGA